MALAGIFTPDVALSRRPDAEALYPSIELTQRRFALQPMPFLTIAHSSLERRQKIKRYIRRLEILRVCVCDVMHQGSERRCPWRRHWL